VAAAAELDHALTAFEEAGRKAAKIELYNRVNTIGVCHEEWFPILGETREANLKIAYAKGRQQLVGNGVAFREAANAYTKQAVKSKASAVKTRFLR
jgi:hypothetical protein